MTGHPNQNDLDKLIGSIEESAGEVIKIEGVLELTEVVSHLNAEGYEATLIDRAPVFDKDTLLHALYQGLSLPGHFGFNWDALKDVLTELDQGESSKGRILVFHDVSHLGDDLRVLCEVLGDANEVLGEHNDPVFRIIAAKVA